MELEPTGERMVEEFYHSSPQNFLIYLFHIATYNFATEFVVGKRVLDYGCGSGYGTHRMASSCDNIVGVDIAEDAIKYARENYVADNLTYQKIERADIAPLPFDDSSFDTVLSFQVIEHIEDVGPYLSEIRRVLKPGGVFVCATPDRSSRLFPGQKPWNMWHVHEYDEKGFGRVLAPYFSTINTLCMSGTKSVLDLEIKRTQKLMWLTLPITLPFVPEAIRIGGLKILKRLANRNKQEAQRNAGPFSFNESDLMIARDVLPSVNLIAVAHKS